MQKTYSAHEIYKSKMIYWVKSYKAILKYIRKYEDIFEPMVVGGNDSSRRYYISKENLRKFIKMFEESKL